MINVAKEVFDIEIEQLENVKNKITEEFNEIIEVILNTKGKIIVTGIGKSGIIGSKIAASLASTGTSAFFMQSAEALHGDLGMVNKNDLVIAISNSGTTQEVLNIVPSLKKIGCKIIAMTGNPKSTLGSVSDYIVNIGVEKEACPLNLAPTCSTTATLVMGDAITVSLINKREFMTENFALYHPGGALGKRLLTRVNDLMCKNLPVVNESADLKDIIYEISNKRVGLTLVSDEKDNIIGLITDGDIRRNLVNFYDNMYDIKAKDIMTKSFRKINYNEMASKAWEVMNENNISSLIVEENNKIIGIISMHDVFEFEK